MTREPAFYIFLAVAAIFGVCTRFALAEHAVTVDEAPERARLVAVHAAAAASLGASSRAVTWERGR